MSDPTHEWNEQQASNVELNFTCSRDNPLAAARSKPRDILAILNEGNDKRRYPDWWHICKMAGDEIHALRFLHQSRANSQLQAMEIVRDLILMVERNPHDHRAYGCSHCAMIARANDYLATAAYHRRKSLEHGDKLDAQEEQP